MTRNNYGHIHSFISPFVTEKGLYVCGREQVSQNLHNGIDLFKNCSISNIELLCIDIDTSSKSQSHISILKYCSK